MNMILLVLLGVVVLCTGTSEHRTLRDLLEERAYNKHERPPTSDGVSCVGVGIYMETVASISELHMDFVISIYLRQQWVDTRLVHNSSSGNLIVDTGTMTDIWQPSLFFVNGKHVQSHDVPVPNRYMMIGCDGTVYFSQKLSVNLYCGMKLTKFPFDKQECPVRMMSYAYSTNMVQLNWLDGNKSVEIRPEVELPEFVIHSTALRDCTETYISGVFSCLEARVLLVRRSMHYLIQIYIPSTLIVILSWANFWIDHRSTPARVSLALLCILTITTQSSGVGANLPRVAYLTAIDVWLSVCLVFVFSAFIEFTLVNIMARRLEKKHPESPVQALQESAQSVSTVTSGAVGIRDLRDPRPHSNGSAFQFFPTNFLLRRHFSPTETFIPPLTLDKYSRVVFPALFIVFNLAYWLTYMGV